MYCRCVGQDPIGKQKFPQLVVETVMNGLYRGMGGGT